MNDYIIFSYAMALIGLIVIYIYYLNYKAHVEHEETMRALANGESDEE